MTACISIWRTSATIASIAYRASQIVGALGAERASVWLADRASDIAWQRELRDRPARDRARAREWAAAVRGVRCAS